MRRPEFAMTRGEATAFVTRAPQFHLAGVDPGGAPVLKTLHGVVDDGWLCFHASPKGEKTSLLDRPVVAATEDVVARVPSTFLDPERACPATTLFRSVQVHGVLTEITDPPRKARVLEALMQKLQPSGGYVPIEAEHPLYRAAVRGLLVAGVPLERVDGKAKLAQNRSVAERTRLITQLWRRGEGGDGRAIELIRAANPGVPVPDFLRHGEVTLHPWLDPDDAPTVGAAVDLAHPEYWNDQFTRDALARAHVGSAAWVGARDANGVLRGSARAMADRGKYAWVYDVCVHADWRRRGIGQALVRLLLDHPAVRSCQRVLLATKDAQSLYARLGFVPRSALPPRPNESTEMVLVRGQTETTPPAAHGLSAR